MVVDQFKRDEAARPELGESQYEAVLLSIQGGLIHDANNTLVSHSRDYYRRPFPSSVSVADLRRLTPTLLSSQATVKGYWQLACCACHEEHVPRRLPNQSVISPAEQVGALHGYQIVDKVVYEGLVLCRRTPSVPGKGSKASSCFRCHKSKVRCDNVLPVHPAFANSATDFLTRLVLGANYMANDNLPFAIRNSTREDMVGVVQRVSSLAVSLALLRR